jgi:hypothetical protein
VLGHPGDNLMIHAGIEQCGPGDVLAGVLGLHGYGVRETLARLGVSYVEKPPLD